MKKNNVGLDAERSNYTIEKLNTLLANYQIHYQNLRALHWLITGKDFFVLHAKYEDWYNEAAERADLLAERIIMLGGIPYHTFEDYIKIGEISVVKNEKKEDKAMADIVNDLHFLLSMQRAVLEVATKADDEVTVDMMISFNKADEKKLWMLNAWLS